MAAWTRFQTGGEGEKSAIVFERDVPSVSSQNPVHKNRYGRVRIRCPEVSRRFDFAVQAVYESRGLPEIRRFTAPRAVPVHRRIRLRDPQDRRGWRIFWRDSRGTGPRQMAALRYILRAQSIFRQTSRTARTRIRRVSICCHFGLLEAVLYCTKPTVGTGFGSGTSRMGPYCASYRLIFSPSALKMRLACAGLTITLESSLPCGTLGNTYMKCSVNSSAL